MNNTSTTIIGIIFTAFIILFSLGISDARKEGSSCPEADCYNEIWP